MAEDCIFEGAGRGSKFLVKTDRDNEIFILNRYSNSLVFLVNSKFQINPNRATPHGREVAFHRKQKTSVCRSTGYEVISCLSFVPDENANVAEYTQKLLDYDLHAAIDEEWSAEKQRFLKRAEILLNNDALVPLQHLAINVSQARSEIHAAASAASRGKSLLKTTPIYALHLPWRLHDKIVGRGVTSIHDLLYDPPNSLQIVLTEDDKAAIERAKKSIESIYRKTEETSDDLQEAQFCEV